MKPSRIIDLVPALFARIRRARLLHDRRGVAATEFALLLPVMVVLNFGLVEVTEGVRLDRRVNQLSRTIADLTSQYQSIANSDKDNIFAAAKSVLAPYNESIAKIRVTSVILKVDGTNCVDWSDAVGMSPLATGAGVTVPTGLRDPAATTWQSVIMSEVEYLFTPVTQQIVGTINLSEKAYMRPRVSERVTRITGPSPCGI